MGGIGRVGLSQTRLMHCNSTNPVKKESDRRKDGTRLARTRANVAPKLPRPVHGTGDILSPRQRHPDFCLFQKASDEIRLQPAIHPLWVSGGQWCRHREVAMRGRPARRIAERQGSRGLDVLSGVWGAHSEVSSLGKSHPSQLGPPVRARRLGPMDLLHQPERLDYSSRQTKRLSARNQRLYYRV